MKKLLSILGALGMSATASSAVVACPKKTTTKIDLNDLEKKDLGEFFLETAETKPSLKEIVEAINTLNKNFNLTENDVEISSEPVQTLTSATLNSKSNSKTFTGSVNVVYRVSEKIDELTFTKNKSDSDVVNYFMNSENIDIIMGNNVKSKLK
ncbi:hypothetical protein SGLAD_v1c09520 [Spiroplasma gladiatoris]|uniref:Lipoprotein n=1 Tax=Spiroplasma gladiatoris TaxID=2143 RepID=A0A4P7AIZ3_9MOLU|nr:lipoprotein [Spiroplasma gladiatoris]QBQ08151.1 hypothetical protein SGLAD_v1c09520 [Spiroplasma gladiatoris]